MSTKLCPFCMRMTEGDTCHHCGKNTDYSGQPMHLPAGYVVSGKDPYVLGAALGQGGFGITYIALNMKTGQRVAIKEYYPTYCSARTENSNVTAYSNQEEVYQKGKERFLDEARTLKSLSDLKSIVDVLDFFEANNSAYLVMEYLEGSSLKEYAAKNGKFPAQKFLEQIKPLMEDIQKMHDRGVIHRDIAPDNIILLPDGQMKLIDFGAARSYLGDKSMTVVVKKGFAPAEQYFSTGSTASTDVYALAATIYYCITGKVPPDSVQRQNEGTPLAAPISLGAGITPKQQKALYKALEIQQKDRIQNVQDLRDQLSAGQKTDSIISNNFNSQKSDRDAKKNTWNRFFVVGMVTAAILAGVALVVAFGPKKTEGSKEVVQTPSVEATTEAPTTETTAPTEPREPWEKNVLAYPSLTSTGDSPAFNAPFARKQVAYITFLDSLDQMGSNSWDVSEAQDGSVMAWAEQNAIILDKEYDLLTNKTYYHELQGYTLYIAAEGGINAKYCAQLFSGFTNLKDIYFNDCFHTDYAESMQKMFYYCEELTELDLSGLQTGHVQSMKEMFFACNNLTHLDLSNLDTANVTSMEKMFNFCKRLQSLNLQGFNTAKVTNMSHMFYQAYALKELNLSSFDTSAVKDMSSMFYRTDALLELDLSNFNTSSVTDMHSMFHGTNIKKLDLSHFDTGNVTDMSYMFFSSALQQLNVTGFDTSNVRNMESMFHYCNSLHKIQGIEDWDVSFVKNYKNFMNSGKRIDGKPWEKFFQKES